LRSAQLYELPDQPIDQALLCLGALRGNCNQQKNSSTSRDKSAVG
jgi:hypothetical protein